MMATPTAILTINETIFDDVSSTIQYIGEDWQGLSASDWFDDTFHWCNGTNITLIGSGNLGKRRFYCNIDDQLPWFWGNATTPGPQALNIVNTVQCQASGLENTAHTLKYGQVPPDGTSDRIQSNGGLNGITLDAYILNNGTPAGDTISWVSDFPQVEPPAGFENTIQSGGLSTIPTSSSKENQSSSSSSTILQTVPSGSIVSSDSGIGSFPTVSATLSTSNSSQDSTIVVGVVGGLGAIGGVALLSVLLSLLWRRTKKRRFDDEGDKREIPKTLSTWGFAFNGIGSTESVIPTQDRIRAYLHGGLQAEGSGGAPTHRPSMYLAPTVGRQSFGPGVSYFDGRSPGGRSGLTELYESYTDRRV
ncbi:hypothetical protein T439DRAFT_360709 [Meredithblackwellia eburnea MCA 4105]